MGVIQYANRNGRWTLADDCSVTGRDGIEELDCSVRLYKLLKQNGYDRIEQVTSSTGTAFYEMECMGLKSLRELLEHLDFLGFRLADWRREQSVDDYYSHYEAAEKRRIAEEYALLKQNRA